MDELEHSPLGGSAAHRFLNCAGSFLLQRALFEEGQLEPNDSEYARLGTAAHKLCALSLQHDCEPFHFIGQKIDGYEVGDAIALDGPQYYFNDCNRIADTDPLNGIMVVEKTYHLKHIHPLLKGQVDFAFVSDTVYIRDYKNGSGVAVDTVGNVQLLYYAYLLLMGEKRCAALPANAVVNMAIVQPYIGSMFDAPYAWQMTKSDILRWGNETLLPAMHELVIQKDMHSSDFVPGDHCQFCPVLLDCPKMQRAFKRFVAGSEEIIEMLTDEELSDYYAERDQARRFMTELENVVHRRLIGGRTIASAKLVKKRGSRQWKDGAEFALAGAFGEKAYSRDLLSPAQIEKLSSTGKAMATEWAYMAEGEGLRVAPITDPAPAAAIRTNADIFAHHIEKYDI